MTADPIREHLNEARELLAGIPAERRAEILQEIQGHLDEAASVVSTQFPALTAEEAAAVAVRRFGKPAEIVSGFVDELPVPRKPAWWTTVRGQRNLLAVLLPLGLITAVAFTQALAEPGPTSSAPFDEADPRFVWVSEFWSFGNETGNSTRLLVMPQEVVNLTGMLGFHGTNADSCLRVGLTDPSGRAVELHGSSNCTRGNYQFWVHEAGLWIVHLEADNFTGLATANVTPNRLGGPSAFTAVAAAPVRPRF